MTTAGTVKQADEYLEYIQTGTKRMAALIEDLLSYSQIVHSTEKGAPVDCNVVLDKVLESCRVIIEENGAIVTRDPLPTVDGDEGQISQLFHNLLTNALKYRKREVAPEVRVSARRTANEWEFSFRDNGIGIATVHLQQIFVIFKRLHKRRIPRDGHWFSPVPADHRGPVWSNLGGVETRSRIDFLFHVA